jgi:YhcH/YjgK/YiaL family protein
MIVDELENWERYFPRLDFVLRCLRGLGGATPDGEYPLQGEQAFARVFTYETRQRPLAVLETHDNHVDVQMVLSGREYLEWYPRRSLEADATYDPAKDATFYLPPAEPGGRMLLAPGRFAVLFPQDGHMTQIQMDRPEAVKKVVVKVRLDLMAGCF